MYRSQGLADHDARPAIQVLERTMGIGETTPLRVLTPARDRSGCLEQIETSQPLRLLTVADALIGRAQPAGPRPRDTSPR